MSSLGTMMDYPLTLDHLLVRAERMFPAVPVVSRLPDRSLHRSTYGQVARRARALAEAQLHQPGFTLRGGTNEILRGIVARGLGLR